MQIDAGKAFHWDAPLPSFYRVRQEFPRLEVKNIAEAVYQAIDEIRDIARLCNGKRIAITAGSRGISDIPAIIGAVVQRLRHYGGLPFIVPAMGSHGGATAEGQRMMLGQLGITEDTVGAPIISSMAVVEVGRLSNGMPVYIDQVAAGADCIVIINRVKPHTDFIGDIESGLAKMAVLGLGKQRGAETVHSYGLEGLLVWMPQAARLVTEKLPVIFGLASVENAYHQVARIAAVPPEGIAGPQEAELLSQAYALMPRFLFDTIDVLIVEEIGKNISGVGMDPNVTGRVKVHGVGDLPQCDIRTIAVLDLTDETHGNASGVGLADVTTRRLVSRIDFEATYINCITAGICGIQRGFLPLVAPTEKAAILTALRTCGQPDPLKARIARIKNTLSLGEIDVSECLLAEAGARDGLTRVSPAFSLSFDKRGRLKRFERALKTTKEPGSVYGHR
jgi:hypothetical protein